MYDSRMAQRPWYQQWFAVVEELVWLAELREGAAGHVVVDRRPWTLCRRFEWGATPLFEETPTFLLTVAVEVEGCTCLRQLGTQSERQNTGAMLCGCENGG